jgi:glycoprotein-N-acetylgalactosamine 3-beta-galactosyltransferase
MENLRYMLYAYPTDIPIYFGCRFKKYIKQGYMSGGAGYVLSKEALRRFAEKGIHDDHKCRIDDEGAEDVELGIRAKQKLSFLTIENVQCFLRKMYGKLRCHCR